MITRFAVRAVVVAALAVPPYVGAHEGHAHKIMGTVSMRHENHLEVKATDGKTVTITLNAKTKILRGKAKVTLDNIKPGERVVVTATETKGQDGKSTMVASEVRLGVANTESKSAMSPHVEESVNAFVLRGRRSSGGRVPFPGSRRASLSGNTRSDPKSLARSSRSAIAQAFASDCR